MLDNGTQGSSPKNSRFSHSKRPTGEGAIRRALGKELADGPVEKARLQSVIQGAGGRDTKEIGAADDCLRYLVSENFLLRDGTAYSLVNPPAPRRQNDSRSSSLPQQLRQERPMPSSKPAPATVSSASSSSAVAATVRLLPPSPVAQAAPQSAAVATEVSSATSAPAAQDLGVDVVALPKGIGEVKTFGPEGSEPPVWIAFMEEGEFEAWELLRADLEPVFPIRGHAAVDRTRVQGSLDDFVATINAIARHPVTEEVVCSTLTRLTQAGVITLIEVKSGKDKGKNTYEFLIPPSRIAVRIIRKRETWVTAPAYAGLAVNLQNSGERFPLDEKGRFVGEEVRRIIEACMPEGATMKPVSAQIVMCGFRSADERQDGDRYGGRGILVAVPAVNSKFALVALPGFEAQTIVVDGSGVHVKSPPRSEASAPTRRRRGKGEAQPDPAHAGGTDPAEAKDKVKKADDKKTGGNAAPPATGEEKEKIPAADASGSLVVPLAVLQSVPTTPVPVTVAPADAGEDEWEIVIPADVLQGMSAEEFVRFERKDDYHGEINRRWRAELEERQRDLTEDFRKLGASEALHQDQLVLIEAEKARRAAEEEARAAAEAARAAAVEELGSIQSQVELLLQEAQKLQARQTELQKLLEKKP